jgi:3-hydroxyisobutyrate dehydrogenase-like beta-hydroxyacid dehydrogenase
MDGETVGVIGLGNLGGTLAHHLLEAGASVVGVDVDAARVDAFVTRGGTYVTSPAAVAACTDRIIVCLPSARALDEVVSGPGGLVEGARPGVVIAETSTLPLSVKMAAQRRIERAGMTLLDCTISGTGGQALTKDIIYYASGPHDSYEQMEPVLLATGRSQHVGAFGNGSKMKYVANLLVSIHTAAAAEALNLASNLGLERSEALELLRAGAGTSRMLDVRGPMMAAREFAGDSATLTLLEKDVTIIQEVARTHGVPTPLLSQVAWLFTAGASMGYGDDDPAVVVEVFGSMSPSAARA